MRYRVVSTYHDGDRVVEWIGASRRAAERAAVSIGEFREDQDEAPTITIEPEAE